MLSVLKDDKDRSLLRFVDVGPIYVSPDDNSGIDDAIKFFPHDFDEMDGEVKAWLAESALDENADKEEGDFVGEELDAATAGGEEAIGEESVVAAV